nr:MAG TPA: hypothetical protein [Caudoviricetes sp.]
MVEMRVPLLINIVYIYINRTCTRRGESKGETNWRLFMSILIKF